MLLSRMSSGAPEIFATVQGEGLTSGLPSVFIRTAECNLKCTWCDTRYTWDWATHDRGAHTTELAPGDIAARAAAIAGPAVRNAVVTGGEPLLQQDELTSLLGSLRAAGFTIEIETNGTVQPAAAVAALVGQWNVSPKLASSGNPLRARHRPAALEWFAGRPAATFKFVVVGPEDLSEVTEVVTALGVPPRRVVLMPEGVDTTALLERSRWLADECRARGYRLGTRLHVLLWGSERGR